MKKYSVFVTIIALGLLVYILMGQPAPDKASSPQVSSSYSASVYASQPLPTAKPTDKPFIIYVKETVAPTAKPATKTYVLNKNTKVFHKPTCSSVKQMKESNKRSYTGTRQSVIDMGYRPCGNCKP